MKNGRIMQTTHVPIRVSEFSNGTTVYIIYQLITAAGPHRMGFIN
jgi:hypothetical protein